MVKNICLLEARRHVALLTTSRLAEYTRRMRILMTRLTTRYGDGPELTLPLVTFTTFLTSMLACQREIGVLIVVERNPRFELRPARRIVTVFAAV